MNQRCRRPPVEPELTTLLHQIALGNQHAYEPIVRRFQDMAVGYGDARLGDLQLAEDAAQEACVTAYIGLPSLHDPAAFPGWFRRIRINHIDRIHCARRLTLPLDVLTSVADGRQDPADLVEQRERQQALATALRCFPAMQRETVILFYIGDYAHAEISAFLAVPVSTVKMRLFHARKRLAQHLLARLAEQLPSQRPSRNSTLKEHVMSYPVHTKAVPAQRILRMTEKS